MAAQKGLEFLLKIGDGASPEVFTTIGGGQSPSFSINNGEVEITSQDDTDRWRVLLAGAAVRSLSASLSGVFNDAAGVNAVEAASRASTFSNFQIVVPDYGTYTGAFNVSSFEFGGEQDGEVTFSVTLESAGTITYAAT